MGSIGAFFSSGTSFVGFSAYALDTIPQIGHDYLSPVIDKLGWTTISGSLIATGNERFIHIGNFRNDNITLQGTTFVGGTINTAYYYVDEVSIVEQACGTDTILLEVPNVFTPNGDGQSDNFKLLSNGYTDLKCTVLNRWGQKISEFEALNGYWDGYTNAGLQVPDGVYYFVITGIDRNSDPVTRTGSVHVLRQVPAQLLSRSS